MSNADVRLRVIGRDGKPIDERVNAYRLRWFEHVLHIHDHRPHRRVMITDIGES